MKFRISNKIWYLFVIIIIFQILFPNVSASGENAQLDNELTVTATPSQQGTGGLMAISIIATFYGGCCYPLYAKDVYVELTLPPEVELVGSITPKILNKFEATAGGGAAPVQFTAAFRSFTPGEYLIKSKVLTSNCGSSEGSITIIVTKGCIITTPRLFPKEPSTDCSTIVTVSAYSPIEDVYINNVTLYYLKMNSDNNRNPNPENETLYWGDGNDKGRNLSFVPIEFEENQWQCEIPKQVEESSLIYWIVTEDNFGNKTTSPPYILEVKNFHTIHFVHNVIIWSVILGSLVGIIIIASVWGYTNKIPIIHSSSKGILLSGSRIIDTNLTNKGDKKYSEKKDKHRNLILLMVFIIALVMIIIAIFMDQYELLRANVGG